MVGWAESSQLMGDWGRDYERASHANGEESCLVGLSHGPPFKTKAGKGVVKLTSVMLHLMDLGFSLMECNQFNLYICFKEGITN